MQESARPTLPACLAAAFSLVAFALLSLSCSRPAPAPAPAAGLPPAPSVAASTVGALRYVLRFPAPQSHYLEVEARLPVDAAGDDPVELMMAVWTPGSYLVREYARHVDAVEAWSGETALAVRKVRKNRWRVASANAATITVRYRIYCRELTVRTNFVDADFAMLNGAPTFLTLPGALDRPHEVELELPPAWSASVTALDPHPSGRPHHYLAPDFDVLVDSPIVAGNPEIHEFMVDGVPHFLVHAVDPERLDLARVAADVETLTRRQVEFWGDMPYDRYLFLNVIAEAGGGLEHQRSTLMLTSRWRFGRREAYVGWLGLVSHEFFHTWNVKNLRPVALGPFDYETENYTESLWIAEGLTSYYGPLLLRRAGLIDRDEYLENLSRTIRSVQETPGRLLKPLGETSFDAWIKHYRPNENSVNTTVSYYSKGAVVGFLLDAEIRLRSGGRASLDDVLRRAAELYSGERGFRPEEFRAVASEIAGKDLAAFFERAVDRAEELDYTPALDAFGLRFQPVAGGASEEGPAAEPPSGWLGLDSEDRDGRLVVTRVRRGTPAHEFGLNVGDEVLALDDYRVAPGRWDDLRAHFPPGTAAELLIVRRGRLRRLPVELSEEPKTNWKLEIDPRAGRRQVARRQAWLEE